MSNTKIGERTIAMTLIEKYKTYRKIGRDLNHKIMKSCLDRLGFRKAIYRLLRVE